jgi:hypothetical protein
VFPTAADSGPVQLQIMPTTIGLPLRDPVWVLAEEPELD